MNLADLHHRLIAAARAHPPSDRVPYAFERRVMEQLPESAAVGLWTGCARLLWRAATPCIALTVLLGAWTWSSGAWYENLEPLDTELEAAVYAAADTDGDGW